MVNVQIVQLTAVIIPCVSHPCFVGIVKEIEGITTQACTEEETLGHLKYAAQMMMEYKRPEALKLIAEQKGVTIESLADAFIVADVVLPEPKS